MIGRLPTSLLINGIEWKIRTDYRDILRIIEAFEDPELSEQEKAYVMLVILYTDFSEMKSEIYQEAAAQASWFLDCGQQYENDKPSCRIIDWNQDEAILFPAINKVAGKEVRAVEYMHWWTFMGLFSEIEEGTFSVVLGIRQKKAKGKKLEKWEQEFYRSNRNLCDIKQKYTAEEQEEIDYLNSLLN